jgi:2-amino-4-hydroxy-6-hydroxymethyldihydropteridine diphosphokinase
MGRAYLSLGSNQSPELHLARALGELAQRFGKLVVSPVYRTPSVGFDGPDFLNLAVALDSDLEPVELNDWLHALEDAHGRRRDVPRFSSRPLDIDIVLYDDRVLRGPGNLEVPRSELVEQAFVLAPMADIAPDLVHPTLGVTLGELWRRMDAPAGMQRTDDLDWQGRPQ